MGSVRSSNKPKHSLRLVSQGKKYAQTGAQAIIKTLEKNGVEYIFGYPGGASIAIFDALATSDTNIKFILSRHEQGATHMADGYARASGKPGVVLVTSGPGAGNTITGLMTAHMDNVPIIVISGQQSRSLLGQDSFQEADIFNMTMPVVKHSYFAHTADELPGIINEAFHVATTGRPGPILIDVPRDVSHSPLGNNSPKQPHPPIQTPDMPDTRQINAVAQAWIHAKRPLIMAGHGVMIAQAERELLQLATTMDTPVATTMLGKGAFPDDHPLALGMPGVYGTPYANKAMVECDFLLNVGARFNDRITGKASEFCKNAFIAHIDIEPSEIGKIIPTDAAIIADARAALTALSKAVKPTRNTNWNQHLDTYRTIYPMRYHTEHGLPMQQVIETLCQLTNGNAVVATDAGQHQIWATHFYRAHKPNHWLSSGGSGTMGFGLPAAIGAQLAQPDKTVIAFVGDGGFQMTLNELATACVNKLPIKVIVLNNHYLGMMRQRQELLFENRQIGVQLNGNPDFLQLAEAYGAAAISINAHDNVTAKLKEALRITDRPVVVNAEVIKTDNVYPLVPPGGALQDMIIDPPASRLRTPPSPKQRKHSVEQPA